MENQEYECVTPQLTASEPVQESVAQIPVPQPQEPMQQGFYHGVGAGQREVPFAPTGAPYGYVPPQPAAKQPWDPYVVTPPVPEEPKQKKEKKGTGKRILAAALVLALVVGSCLITGVTVSSVMKKQNDILKLHFEEKLAILQDRLEKVEGVGEGVGPLEPVEGNLTASEVYEHNIRSVVAINCTATATNVLGQVYQSTSAGSGFVMTQDGYIVTNHHVISGATKITVTFEDGTEYAARLIGSDSSSDIALIKVEATGLQPVTMGSSSQMAVGDQVVAIGNALGELSFSLTVGYISGMDRDVSTDGSVMNMMQTDAAINSGNSGGPLFNARGEVIGINTAKYSGTTSSGASIEGISFAIPMDDVIGMLEDLRDYGYIRGASMGVYVTDMDAATADKYNLPLGVYIQEVMVGSAAQKAGMQAKDIIVEVGGYEIENMNDLTRALRNFQGGQTATITVWRGGTEIILTITFDEKNAG